MICVRSRGRSWVGRYVQFPDDPDFAAGGTAPTPAAELGAPEAASTAGEAAASESAAQPVEAGSPVTLRIMHWNTEMVEETAWWKEVLDGFTAQHPNVTIENNFVPFAQYLTTLAAMTAGESFPTCSTPTSKQPSSAAPD